MSLGVLDDEFGVGGGGVIAGRVDRDEILPRAHRWWGVFALAVGGELRPELKLRGVQGLGDTAAVAGVGEGAVEPSADGFDVDVDQFGKAVGLHSGVLQGVLEVFVRHFVNCCRAFSLQVMKTPEDVRGHLHRRP